MGDRLSGFHMMHVLVWLFALMCFELLSCCLAVSCKMIRLIASSANLAFCQTEFSLKMGKISTPIVAVCGLGGHSLVTCLCFVLDVAGIWASLKCGAVPGLLSSLSLRFAQSQRLASRRFPLFSLSQVNSSVLNPFHAKLVCVALRMYREE